MQKGILVDCPSSLMDSWGSKLQERGMTVRLKPPPSTEALNAMGGVLYREGTVEHNNTTIDVWGCPAPPAPHPLSGKQILLLTFRSEQTRQLASLVGNILVELGGSIIEPPN